MRIFKKSLLYFFAIILVLFTSYPFLYMISTSFKTMDGFFINPFSVFPETFTIEQFISVFEMGLLKYFVNSVIITVLAVVLVVIISALASYPLSRMKFKLNRPLFLFFLVRLMIFINAILIPFFIFTY